MKKLTIVRGVPGAGKNTIVEERIRDQVDGTQALTIDKHELVLGLMETLELPKEQAELKAQIDIAENIEAADVNVYLIGVFDKAWEVQYYEKLAERLGIHVGVMRIEGNHANSQGLTLEEVTVIRNGFEDYPGEQMYHNVSTEQLFTQAAEVPHDLIIRLKSPWCHIHLGPFWLAGESEVRVALPYGQSPAQLSHYIGECILSKISFMPRDNLSTFMKVTTDANLWWPDEVKSTDFVRMKGVFKKDFEDVSIGGRTFELEYEIVPSADADNA